MSEFSVNTSAIKDSVGELDTIEKGMREFEIRLSAVKNNRYVKNFELTSVLETLSCNMQYNISCVTALKKVLIQTEEAYMKTEKLIYNDSNGKKDTKDNNHNKNDDTNKSVNDEEAYKKSMMDAYGFSDEEAELLMDAYNKFIESDEAKGMNNKEKINAFYSNLASLYSSYSSDSKLFGAMGDNPSQVEAIKFFNDLGVDGESLKEIVNNQHSSCGNSRDFAHECAIYSVMANDSAIKGAAGLVDDIDALVGYKGDIYSKSMGMDDVKSDIAAENIYNRMLNCEDGDIWGAMVDYNEGCSDGTINESKEFLENMGNGNAEKGMKNLIKNIDDTSLGTAYLSGEYGGGYGTAPYSYSNYGYSGYNYNPYGYTDYGYMTGQNDSVEDCRSRFLDYLSEQSGVEWR